MEGGEQWDLPSPSTIAMRSLSRAGSLSSRVSEVCLRSVSIVDGDELLSIRSAEVWTSGQEEQTGSCSCAWLLGMRRWSGSKVGGIGYAASLALIASEV